MKKILPTLFCIFTVFFLVKYEGYTWNPCSIDKNGLGTCLAISCPLGGCTVSEEIRVCTDTQCVKEILKKRGTEHLEGVYRVIINDGFTFQDFKVEKVNIIKSYDLEFK